jgi:ribonuclease BN (tRNA processing enzyme)
VRIVRLTDVEKRLFGEEARDYSRLVKSIGQARTSRHVAGVELTVIGNAGGAANVAGGRPCGGFLLRYGTRNVIVDPGEASMTWLAGHGFDPYQITDVIATHTHNDHVGQLSQAVSGAVNLGLGQPGDGKIVVAPALIDYDEPSATQFGFTLPRYAWSAEVVPLYWRVAEATRFDGKKLQAVAATELASGVRVTATEARHGAVMAMGVVFDTPFGRLGYTADTEYFDGLAEAYAGADVLWLNLSTLGIDPDADQARDERTPTHQHLGYVGVCKLLEQIRPRTAIVSHFGVQLTEKRGAIEAALRDRFAPMGIEVFCPDNGATLTFNNGLGGRPRLEAFAP